MTRHTTRRAVVLGVAGLVGCLGQGGAAETSTPTATPEATSEPAASKDTLTPTPTATATPEPVLQGAGSGDLPGEIVRDDYDTLSYRVLYADVEEGEFSVGVFATNEGESDTAQIKAEFTLYSGERKLGTEADYVSDIEAGTREKLDTTFRENVDAASRWTLAVINN